MNMTTRLIALAFLVCGIVAFGTYLWMSPKAPATKGSPKTELRLEPRTQMTAAQAALVKTTLYAPEVERVLSEQASVLAGLAADPILIAQVENANLTDGRLSPDDITRLDKNWIAATGTPAFIQPFLTNDAARRLLAFQKDHPSFKEIFVTDAISLNVGQTDKTSDYYQADESWWVNAWNGGTGKIFHGNIEFDQSSQTEAISLYVPLIDPASSKAIGVMKGVLDLSTIKGQL